jgi:SAM-dependent methyltransferase
LTPAIDKTLNPTFAKNWFQSHSGGTAMSQRRKSVDETSADEAFANVRLCLSVFDELPCPVTRADTILDFGSGDGWMVYAYRKLGYNAFGVDIAPPAPDAKDLIEKEGLSEPGEEVFRVIDGNNYRIPFENDYFNYVFSWNVMEHVQDHGPVFSEMRRVLKPCGRSLHYFPAKYRPIEPHTSAPLGGVIQRLGYLYLCALMGFRNGDDKSMSPLEVARKNYDFLKNETKYLTGRELERLAKKHFGNMEFVEGSMCKHQSGRSGMLCKLPARLGFKKATQAAASLLRTFGSRAVLFVKTDGGLVPEQRRRDRSLACSCCG